MGERGRRRERKETEGERESESEPEWGRGTESKAGSSLRAVSTEPDAGLEPTNREVMT